MEGLSGSGSAAGAAWVLGARSWGLGWGKGEVADSDDELPAMSTSPASTIATCGGQSPPYGFGLCR